MDFVHDVLHSWTFRVLAFVNNWSPQSPVLDGGFPMSEAIVGDALNLVLNGEWGGRFSETESIRSFCYGYDIVRGIIASLADSDKTVEQRSDKFTFLEKSVQLLLKIIHDSVNVSNPHRFR